MPLHSDDTIRSHVASSSDRDAELDGRVRRKIPSKDEKRLDAAEAAELAGLSAVDMDGLAAVGYGETPLDEEGQRRLLRKIDWHLLPVMMSVMGMQYADKVSLSVGVVFKLKQDTGMASDQYAWLTTIFYLGYMVFQPVLNYTMQRVNAACLLSGLIVLWGGVVMCLGACNSFAQLMAVRFFLGALEGGVAPGFLLIIASWYRKSEQNSRSLCYLSMNPGFSIWTTVAIYFLAKHSEESGGMSGWHLRLLDPCLLNRRVINLFLGAVTVSIGLVACLLLRLPADAWWLSEVERKAALARTVENATGGGDTLPWRWEQVADAFADPNTYFLFFISIAFSIPNGGITTFQTVIFASFGFTALQSVLYQLPTFALSVSWIFFCLTVLRFYPRLRFFFMTFTVVPTFVSVLTVGLLPSDESYKWTKYGVYVMSTMFALQTFLMWSAMPSLIAGRTKKTVVSTTTFVGYCTGSIIGPQAFRASDAPRYTTGLIVIASLLAALFFLCLAWFVYLVCANAYRRKRLRDMDVNEEERTRRNRLYGSLDMTDNKNIYFLYNW